MSDSKAGEATVTTDSDTDSDSEVTGYRQSLERFQDFDKLQRTISIGKLGDLTIHQERYGIGGVAWDLAVVMSRWFASADMFRDYWKGRKVIELGAGTGLVGIVCALLGAQVTVTDSKDYVSLMRMNVEANCRSDSDRVVPPVTVRAYWWGTDPAEAKLDPPYDVVVASEVTYDEAAFEPLAQALNDISGPNTVVWLATEHRPLPINLLWQLLDKHWVSETMDQDKIESPYSYGEMDIYKLTKKPQIATAPSEELPASSEKAAQ